MAGHLTRGNALMSNKSIYLGDGAYASFSEFGDLNITADHHDPDIATGAVIIERASVKELIEFLKTELGTK
jgi:hypothetical protein